MAAAASTAAAGALMLSARPTDRTTALRRPSLSRSIIRSNAYFPFRSRTNSQIKPISLTLTVSNTNTPASKIMASASRLSPPPTTAACPKRLPSSLSGSTRTLATLAALAFSVSRLLLQKLSSSIPLLSIRAALQDPSSLAHSVGPLFFAALKDRPSGYLNTPLTVVAAGLAKWLDIYSGVLMVRVLLSWFPNIPWDRQPLSAIRDLCDPYLTLFRNIIPPIFDTLDVSPLLAFAVLGTLGSILNSSRGMY